MKLISSKATFMQKRVFPIIWFAGVGGFLTAVIATGVMTKAPVLLLVPLMMGVVGFIMMKQLVWTLVDEVHDCGDSLLVRNRGEEDRVPLENVMNVGYAPMQKPPRIILRLRAPSRFGSEIAFLPAMPMTLNPFAKCEVAEDLIARVDRARTRAT